MTATDRSAVRVQGLERYHFALRRLHSLTGVVPVGVFLVEHLLTNFSALLGRYSEYVAAIQRMPWLGLIEWTFIFLPLAFHGLYGLFIATTGRSNVLRYRFGGNIRYTLQRATAVLAVVFIAVHLFQFRFNHVLPVGIGGRHFTADNALEFTMAGLRDWRIVAFYVVGISAAVYHFSNGLWSAAITWGLTLGPRSQWRMGWICVFVGLTLEALGLSSLFWFFGANGRT